MQQFTDALTAIAAGAIVLIPAMIWQSPDMMRWMMTKQAKLHHWLNTRWAMRIAYIEAGRDAAETERKRFEVTA